MSISTLQRQDTTSELYKEKLYVVVMWNDSDSVSVS